MGKHSLWSRLRAETLKAMRETNFAYTRLAEINQVPARGATTPLRWERTWRGTRLVGSILPEQRRGAAEI